MEYIMGGSAFVLILIAAAVATSLVSIAQGTIGVVTMFGKYQRIMRPGLNVRIPFIEQIFKRISTQNKSVEIEFQAITSDQANVHFKALILYSVLDSSEEAVNLAAFKFVNDSNFMQSLIRSVEGSVRGYVATRKQAEILSLRREIVHDVKEQLDHVLEGWGYHLIDLQLNDIMFDEEITRSMAKVVASNNLKAAAENEGQALLITKTKSAEADGNAIKIAAEAEKIAAKLRGEGVALFRQEVARGMAEAAKEMQDANMDTSVLMFAMWTEAVKNFAQDGKGNVIFLDGSTEGMQKTLKDMMALQQMKK
jgi:regulator of protease activity HflC (stomatin/prohibitin superfamily)